MDHRPLPSLAAAAVLLVSIAEFGSTAVLEITRLPAAGISAQAISDLAMTKQGAALLQGTSLPLLAALAPGFGGKAVSFLNNHLPESFGWRLQTVVHAPASPARDREIAELTRTLKDAYDPAGADAAAMIDRDFQKFRERHGPGERAPAHRPLIEDLKIFADVYGGRARERADAFEVYATGEASGPSKRSAEYRAQLGANRRYALLERSREALLHALPAKRWLTANTEGYADLLLKRSGTLTIELERHSVEHAIKSSFEAAAAPLLEGSGQASDRRPFERRVESALTYQFRPDLASRIASSRYFAPSPKELRDAAAWVWDQLGNADGERFLGHLKDWTVYANSHRAGLSTPAVLKSLFVVWWNGLTGRR